MGSIEILEYVPQYVTEDIPRLFVAGILALGTALGSITSPI
ncbi:hypothetical protein [Hoyosella subflava]|uniref:Uncharacterized protein n=1 Tax=Hoyosella subflava (strain DSM 45089 / JCM 17490 / NBRC 109087 / DQS3-9A1) TaxID=443218 RepID=F6ERG0_HOYSD|nr:hypothetical protein [Hoyosella subflava]AEF38480.1 hypothetical protein AS9A_0020 [Hoyosella subflava DQS3-9A1]